MMPWLATHTFTVRSCEPEYMRPCPPQRRQVTEAVCPDSWCKQRPVRQFHTLTSRSFEQEASSSHFGFACIGSQETAVTHLRWPVSPGPAGFPRTASHTKRVPSFPPVASIRPSGDQAVQSTQSLWPRSVKRGVSVVRSQSRTVESPEAVARCFPSGEKVTCRMASAWPASVLVQRVTDLTRKTACGTYVTSSTCSADALPSAAPIVVETSSPLT
mmetsp:Transcript_23914/g.56778  ORF Transcript_23914/g.56778 Transcript_23914/m.56778 type:complete len:215 (-) Transcript_23914:150-794(-)